MLINPKIKEMVEARYYEMKNENKVEDFFNQSTFGGLKIFIDKKPKYSLSTFVVEDDSKKVEIFLGSDTI
ncbi:MAG: hypothetical protein WAV23_04390 [Minisyncoccia bacterium]